MEYKGTHMAVVGIFLACFIFHWTFTEYYGYSAGTILYSMNETIPQPISKNLVKPQNQPPPYQKKISLNSQRLNYLAEACELYKDELHYHHHRLIVDFWHNLLYCEISKGGCSTIKAVWMDLNKSKKKNLKTVNRTYNANSAHHITNKLGLNLRLSEGWPSGYENYTKFAVVRHPLNRLVSAYYNLVKFKPGMADHTYEVVSHLKRKLRIGQLTPNTLSFETFLLEVTNKKSPIYKDRHWNPISDTCSICHVKYNYLLRLETIFKEFQPIASILGHPQFDLSTYGSLNGRSSLKSKQDKIGTWSKYLPEFRTIPEGLMKDVMKRYQFDLKLFGYTFNSTTFVAGCSISKDGETEVC